MGPNVEGVALLSLLGRSRIYLRLETNQYGRLQVSLGPSDKMTRNCLKFGHDWFRPHTLQMITYY